MIILQYSVVFNDIQYVVAHADYTNHTRKKDLTLQTLLLNYQPETVNFRLQCHIGLLILEKAQVFISNVTGFVSCHTTIILHYHLAFKRVLEKQTLPMIKV